MIILVDTNILINLEDNKIIHDSFSKFYKLAISNFCKVCYHPLAIPKDIQRDKNDERKNIMLSKLKKYEELKEPAEITSEFFSSKIGATSANDECDNIQLYQLFKQYVDLFVTQDKGIHKKADKLGLQAKTLDIEQVVYMLEDNFRVIIPRHPILGHGSIRQLENEFQDSFFDSLRSDYDPILFSKWLNKCLIQNRQCYFVKSEEKLVALLVFNEEKTEDHQIPNIYDNVLKICTLKVSDSLFGVKIGELFLQKMFEYCINQKIKHLYLTVYEKQVNLISLLLQYGFKKEIFVNKQQKTEIRMIKTFDKDACTLTSNSMSNHPFYTDREEVQKFVIPIQTQFYNILFKDGKLRSATLFDQQDSFIREMEGNSIMKAYVSGSRQKNLNQGDILFFYASGIGVIEPYGILETIEIVSDFDRLWEIVRKKTVFSPSDLKKMLSEKSKLNVITFRLVSYLTQPIKLPKIKEFESFRNNIQTITHLRESDYKKLKQEGYIDQRFIIN